MRDTTHRRAEYERLVQRLVDLWMDPGGLDRREVDRVCARLRELLRESGLGKK